MSQEGEQEWLEYISPRGHQCTVRLGLMVRSPMRTCIADNVPVSFWEMMVLKTELKSLNSILTEASLLLKWERARWRPEDVASSEDQFGP